VFLGLDLFFRNKNISLPLKAFLDNINMFSLWWILLMSIGLSIFTKLSRRKAAMIIFVIWSFNILLQVGLASLISVFK